VVYIDRFGNAVTCIDAPLLAERKLLQGRASCPGCESIPLRSFYQQVGEGEPVALIGSSDFMEIAINRGSAAEQFGLKVGDPVEVFTEGEASTG
jgi:S-adenosylmethionine hydrolase